MIQTVKFLVVGGYNVGLTTFINNLSEKDEDQKSTTVPMNFGRITISNALVMYFFGLNSHDLLDKFLGPELELIGGFILLVDSTNPEQDRQNLYFLKRIQAQNYPYLIAFSRQDLPDARTPQQIHEALSIPDDIKVLGYNWQDPRTVKQIVLELIELGPKGDIVQQVIGKLRAQIAAP